MRVSLGGHHIPSKTVRRRQLRCFENFWQIYRPLADAWSILDNSNTKPRLILNLSDFLLKSEMEKQLFSKKFLKGKI
jgi:predicted ABC-type ATPase